MRGPLNHMSAHIFIQQCAQDAFVIIRDPP